MRNPLKLLFFVIGTKRSVLFLTVFFCLSPKFVLGDNGSLGPSSGGSAHISVVVPEMIQTNEVRIDRDKLLTCGKFSTDLSFLTIRSGDVERLSATDSFPCQNGQSYSAPANIGTATIFIPSSAS